MSKNIEKMVTALNMGKAVNVLEPFITAIASACIAQSEAAEAAALERNAAKEVKGKAYDHVRKAIIAAAEADDVPVPALAEAFAGGLAVQGVPDNTIRPYASTLKHAALAIRENRVTVEQVNSLQMNDLRNACKSDTEKLLASLRKEIKEAVTRIKPGEDYTATKAEADLREVLKLVSALAPAKPEPEPKKAEAKSE